MDEINCKLCWMGETLAAGGVAGSILILSFPFLRVLTRTPTRIGEFIVFMLLRFYFVFCRL